MRNPCDDLTRRKSSKIVSQGPPAKSHQYIRGYSHFSPLEEYFSKMQFANYLPTLGLTGQHYTQGDQRQRISRFPSWENCHLRKISVPGPVGRIRLLATGAEPIVGQV